MKGRMRMRALDPGTVPKTNAEDSPPDLFSPNGTMAPDPPSPIRQLLQVFTRPPSISLLVVNLSNISTDIDGKAI
jgi:hypothetical protein